MGPLTYTATSSNTELVTVQIVDGNKLQITYANYASNQDRTPAEIIVTATETGATAGTVSDTFTVTVDPISPVEVIAVVRYFASTENVAEGVSTLPTSVDEVYVGTNYVVEYWMRDSYLGGTAAASPGLGGASIDVSYDQTIGSIDQSGLYFEGWFDEFATSGTVDQANGLIGSLGGGCLTEGVGVGGYVRLGYTAVEATGIGTQSFEIDVETIARYGGGVLDLAQIEIVNGSVEQVAAPEGLVSFDIGSMTSLVVGGQINGQTLVPDPSDANTGKAEGTVLVVLDDAGNPSSMQIPAGFMDVVNYAGPPFSPGVGGEEGWAAGDFAFTSDQVTTLIEMAIRDMVVDFSSGNIDLSASGGATSTFSAQPISTIFSSGDLDTLSKTGSTTNWNDSFELSGRDLVGTAGDSGVLVSSAGGMNLSLSMTRQVDLSDIPEFGAGSYLTVTISFDADSSTSAPLQGTVVADPKAVATPTGIFTTVSKEKTSVDALGEVAALPNSEAWIDEWDAHWVEVWVKADEGAGVTAAEVDLTYEADYFTATAFEPGPAFAENFTGDWSVDGSVLSLGGEASLEGAGTDGYVLLGRVKLESLAGDNVALDLENGQNGPHDLGLSVELKEIEIAGIAAPTADVAAMPHTQVWAVPMDANDDGSIDLVDVLGLIGSYQVDVLETNDVTAMNMDFDHNGRVELVDLLGLIGNYGISKSDGVDLCLPENFTQTWVGTNVVAEGDNTVDEVFQTALETWAIALGQEELMDIQLVVDDLDGSQLGEGQIVEVGEDGTPTMGRVTIDSDAAGIGWYADVDETPVEGCYDLYTVMLHEIGHTLGFVGGYDGFDAYLESDATGTVFVGPNFEVQMDAPGNHIADSAYADDLMAATLEPGQRKAISELDVQMIALAQAASDGTTVAGASLRAAMHGEADGLAVQSVSTGDFDRIEGSLKGEMTWDRLFQEKADRVRQERGELVDSVLVEQLPGQTESVAIVETGFSLDEADSFDWAVGAELVGQTPTDGTSEEDESLDVLDTVFDDWNA